ncbi:MAG: DUF4864 domain-containing protein [Almyronema sp.]
MTLIQSEQVAIRLVIEDQLKAFQANDSYAAFALVAPKIQQKFKTADNFLHLIKTDYAPLYRPSSVVFEGLTFFQNTPTQLVMFLSQRAELFRAMYLMEKQKADRWLIQDFFLFAVDE